ACLHTPLSPRPPPLSTLFPYTTLFRSDTGDGAGLLIQVPDEFFRAVVDFDLPPAGRYAVGTAFLPTDDAARESVISTVERIAVEKGMRVLGWRDLPIDRQHVGRIAASTMPAFKQLFLAPQDPAVTGLDLERLAYVV